MDYCQMSYKQKMRDLRKDDKRIKKFVFHRKAYRKSKFLRAAKRFDEKSLKIRERFETLYAKSYVW